MFASVLVCQVEKLLCTPISFAVFAFLFMACTMEVVLLKLTTSGAHVFGSPPQLTSSDDWDWHGQQQQQQEEYGEDENSIYYENVENNYEYWARRRLRYHQQQLRAQQQQQREQQR